jgi:mxaJ protein
MSSLFRRFLLGVLLAFTLHAQAKPPLRVCADPDDLPFSSSTHPGFDNKVALLLAEDINRQVVFVWSRARRGFLRERFNKRACDVLMGVPEGMKHVLTTQPYYRSSYVFVTRRSDDLQLTHFDDSSIRHQRIGLQILEEDLSPPSLPLIRSGHAAQLIGFNSFGAEAGDIVRAVADKRVGFSVVWGPLAGYYAAQQKTPLTLSVVQPGVDASGIPFSYAICVAVHQGDERLAAELNSAIERRRVAIGKILVAYHVPLDRNHGASL